MPNAHLLLVRTHRGHLGLRTFAYILADPRTRDIPLVLETPAYDVPSSGSSAAARERLAKEGMSVWRTEVSVLNRLSGRRWDVEDGKADGADGDAGVLEESELESCKAQIRDAVETASKLKDAKETKKQSASKGAKRNAKQKASEKDKDEDEEDNEGEGSCCDSEH